MLRKLGHIDAAGLVQLKGKAACEVDRELPSDSKICALGRVRQRHGAAAVINVVLTPSSWHGVHGLP